jgi:hypothetical protein
VATHRSRLHAADILGIRRLIPSRLKRMVLAALVRRRTGADPRAVTTRQLRFSPDRLDEAPTFFVIARK